MAKITTDFTLNFNADSLFQKSPSGISFRIPKKWTDLFNQHIRRIGQNAADIAKSRTPFTYFQNDWKAKFTYGGKYGIVDSVMVYNTKANNHLIYQSKYSNSGKLFSFPVKSAISIMEIPRKKNYFVTPINAQALTIPPTARTGSLSKDGTTKFAKHVLIKKSPKITKPVTSAMKYMVTGVNRFFSNAGKIGIDYVPLANVSPYQAGSAVGKIRHKSRNFFK